MRIAICDDNPSFSQTLRAYIENAYKSLDLLIEFFNSGEALLGYYQENKKPFDVILLDIEMAQINGLEAAHQIRKVDTKTVIIFITSHDELASMGYEVSAFRFLTKPVKAHKLIEALEAVRIQNNHLKTIHVSNPEGDHTIPVDDILFLEAQNQMVRIQTQGSTFIQRYSLSEYGKELAKYNFISVHRSFLVNMKYIKSISKQDVTMTDGTTLPISRLKYQDVKQHFFDYIHKTSI